jgi:hypothetical protein
MSTMKVKCFELGRDSFPRDLPVSQGSPLCVSVSPDTKGCQELKVQGDQSAIMHLPDELQKFL